MKILILMFLLNGFYFHDIQVAFFKLNQENGNFTIEIVMEKDDVKSTFDALDIILTDSNLQNYLSKNLSLLINKEEQTLCFEKMQTKDKHIRLMCNIHEMNEDIQSLELRNTCLLNIENHSNIIEIRIDETERDFLMNKQRTTIVVKY